ncbi:MAG: sugar phosphate isomerase/epimerase family protein [Thermoproteota archaeon]
MFSISIRLKGVRMMVDFPWKTGLVEFMAFPQAQNEAHIEAVEKISEDPFFDLVETTLTTYPILRRSVEVAHAFGKEVAVGLQPLVLNKDRNPSSTNENKRTGVIREFKEIIRIVKEMGVKTVSLCSGPDLPENRDAAKNALIESLMELTEEAECNGVYVLLETFDRDRDRKQLLGPIEEAAEVLRRVRGRRRSIGLLWDLSHAPLLNEDPDVLKDHRDVISHIHIGCAKIIDSSMKDWHPGFYRKGSLNTLDDVTKLIEILDSIRYEGAVSFEVKPEENQDGLEVISAAKGVLYSAFARFIAERRFGLP